MQIIIKYIKFLILSKKKFFIPKNVSILIFDYTGSINFTKYLKRYKYSILRTRFEELNISILFKTLINFQFSYQNYLMNYINAANPKIVLTFIDNNPLFYKLKNRNTKFKTILIQNGIRSSFNDVFATKHKLKKKENFVDYMFVANEIYAKKYSSFIKGKTIPIGFFRNNMFRILKKKRKKEVLLISVFRNYRSNKQIHKNINFGVFFSNEPFFLKWLNEYCIKNNLKVNILARSSKLKDFVVEKKYFKKFFLSPSLIYEKYNPYKYLDSYEYIITNDSTLGIENLSRGGKTAFICNSPNIYPLTTRKFGFNENFNKNGPFWTWENKIKRFDKVMNFLIKNKNNEWKKYTKNIFIRDDKNKIFKKTLNKLLNLKKI